MLYIRQATNTRISGIIYSFIGAGNTTGVLRFKNLKSNEVYSFREKGLEARFIRLKVRG